MVTCGEGVFTEILKGENKANTKVVPNNFMICNLDRNMRRTGSV